MPNQSLSEVKVENDPTYSDNMQVNALLIEWMMWKGYYSPSDTNEPVKMLKEMTEFVTDLMNGVSPPWLDISEGERKKAN